MTEKKYKQLKELHETMYAIDYDMGNIKDVRCFKSKLERLTEAVDNLLLMHTEEFSSTIEDFDKKYLGPLYEKDPEY